MTKITALTLSLFFLVNIFTPHVTAIANLDCDDFLALVEQQPIVQYYNNISNIPIKIVSSLFFDGGLLSRTSKHKNAKEKTNKPVNNSSEFALINLLNKLQTIKKMRSLLPVSLAFKTALPQLSSGCKLPPAGHYSILLLLLILLLIDPKKRFFPIRATYLNHSMLARGNIEDAIVLINESLKDPIRLIFGRVFLLVRHFVIPGSFYRESGVNYIYVLLTGAC
jgi:hypothetical protein